MSREQIAPFLWQALIRSTEERVIVSRYIAVETQECLHKTQAAVRSSQVMIRRSDDLIRKFCIGGENGNAG